MLIHFGSRQIMRIPPDPDLQNTDALNPVDPDRNCRLSLRKLSGTSCICTLGASFSSFSCRARKKYRYSVYNAWSSSFYMDDLVNQLGQLVFETHVNFGENFISVSNLYVSEGLRMYQIL